MKWQDKKAEVEFFAKHVRDEQQQYKLLDHIRLEKEIDLLGIASLQNKLVLDAGCGIGVYGLVLASKGNKVVSIDISADSLKVARNWVAQSGLPVAPVEGDIERLPFKDGTFDICFCGFILHHLPVIKQAIAEIYRVLKPGGVVALIEPNGSNPVAKFSCTFRLYLLRRIMERIEYVSPNERAYSHKHYLDALREVGFKHISYSSHHVPEGKSTTRGRHTGGFVKQFFRLLLTYRKGAFLLCAKFLPQPYKWPTLYITGTKLPRDKP